MQGQEAKYQMCKDEETIWYGLYGIYYDSGLRSSLHF